MKLPAYFLLAASLAATPALAQHQNHQMPGMAMPTDTTHRATGKGHHMPGMAMPGDSSHAGHHMAGMDMGEMNMSHAYSRNLPMNRNGSGTAWQPDQTPMYMWMQHQGPWMLMYHGSAFGRYTSQNFNHRDARGHRSAVDGPNWAMVMAQRNVGQRGLLNLSLMMSLDPLTETRGGYPLLFQTGESYKGQPLIDKQHPHDLFSGLSVAYTYAFSKDIDLTAYLGYPGEPTIGPTAFMHRISAMPNPDAPLSHHWTDATHITYGVASLGLRYKKFKLEGSNFTGREPDQYRYDFDRPRADSWAARLNWNPTSELALQVSRAFIKSPEDLHPDENVRRTTASVLHSRTWGDHQFIASSLVWGLNQGHGAHAEHAVLAETNLTLGRPTFYGRYEWVQKSSEELSYYVPGPADAPLELLFNVHALTRLTNLGGPRGPELSVGGQITGYAIPSTLQNDQRGRGFGQQLGYGKLPLSASVYVRLTAPWMQMGRM
jgi:hypothetical protein